MHTTNKRWQKTCNKIPSRARQLKFIRSLWIICAYTSKTTITAAHHVRTLKVGWQRAQLIAMSACWCYSFYYKQNTYDNLYKHAIKYILMHICVCVPVAVEYGITYRVLASSYVYVHVWLIEFVVVGTGRLVRSVRWRNYEYLMYILHK